jgi:predicted N-acetyltransferase YhbS
MITIRHEFLKDLAAREALLDLVFGDARYTKASERIREGRLPADGLSFAACDRGRLVGTVRLWHVSAGPERAALLLGPLAVRPEYHGRGIGGALMRHALDAAKRLGHRAVMLVGDSPYYGRFGFSAEKASGLWLAEPFERHRLLALELVPGALAGAAGLIDATGRLTPITAQPKIRFRIKKQSTLSHAA